MTSIKQTPRLSLKIKFGNIKGGFQCKLVYSTYFWKIYSKIVILGQRMVTVSRLTQNNQIVDTTHIMVEIQKK